ncbi:hypothetical protein HY491_01365 [Candidatus Woesearchaeota archaeon]|nr:hypothetical protein [Candidatus Woesearchaeota archaeon]
MDHREAYRRLNRGERIDIGDITEADWRQFDREQFWRMAFHSDLPLGYCTTSVLVDHFRTQIRHGADYLAHVLVKANQERTDPEQIRQIDIIRETYATLRSYLSRPRGVHIDAPLDSVTRHVPSPTLAAF